MDGPIKSGHDGKIAENKENRHGPAPTGPSTFYSGPVDEIRVSGREK